MSTSYKKIFGLFILALGMIFSNLNFAPAFAENDIVVVYTSWSATSRALRPTVNSVATSHQCTYKEFDIESPSTSADLTRYNLATPTETPYVAVIKNGKVIFQKVYTKADVSAAGQELNSILSK